MWKKILEEMEVLKTSGDPSPKTPQNPKSNQFPSNEEAKKDPKGKKAETCCCGKCDQNEKEDPASAMAEGTAAGETEDKSKGQSEFEKKYFVTKKQPNSYDGKSELENGGKANTPSKENPSPGKYVAFPKNDEPTSLPNQASAKKIQECVCGATLVLAAILSETEESTD